MQNKISNENDIPLCLFRSTLVLRISNNNPQVVESLSQPAQRSQNAQDVRCIELKLPTEASEQWQTEQRDYRLTFFKLADFLMNFCLLTSVAIAGVMLFKIFNG